MAIHWQDGFGSENSKNVCWRNIGKDFLGSNVWIYAHRKHEFSWNVHVNDVELAGNLNTLFNKKMKATEKRSIDWEDTNTMTHLMSVSVAQREAPADHGMPEKQAVFASMRRAKTWKVIVGSVQSADEN